jgi:long-chain acyl-CoA synthetase
MNRDDVKAELLEIEPLLHDDRLKVEDRIALHGARLDRAKDMLIRGGENIYCVEIEDALLSHPDILDAAVVGMPDRVLGELVGAVVQLKSGAMIGAQDVIEHLRPRLAAFKLPVHVDLRTDELPRTASGKIGKTRLRQEIANKFGMPLG